MPHLAPPTLTATEQRAILRVTAGNIRDRVPADDARRRNFRRLGVD